jgi:signal peptidase
MTDSSKVRRYGIRVLDLGSSVALALLLLAVLAVLLAPHVLGWRYGILRSGSMSPAMPAGAAIVLVPAGADQIRVGDVITFRSAANRGLLVTHRVFEVTTDDAGQLAFRTKGDANKDPDGALATPDRLIGRVVYSVPHAGQIANQLHTKTGFLILMVIPTALIIAMELRELGSGIKDMHRERKKPMASTLTGEDGFGTTA